MKGKDTEAKARQGKTKCGKAKQSKARQSKATRGKARQFKVQATQGHCGCGFRLRPLVGRQTKGHYYGNPT